jgi:hypothetical protein
VLYYIVEAMMKLIKIGMTWFVFFLILATLFPPEGYNSFIYTMSELAHQGYERAFILLIGFYGNGVFFIASGMNAYKNKSLPPLLYKSLFVSGLCIIGLGLFQTNYDYYGIRATDNQIWMYLHIVCAVLNHLIGYVMVWYHINHSEKDLKKIHTRYLILNVILVAMFVLTPVYRGLFQRVLFIIGGIWFWYYFNVFKNKKNIITKNDVQVK